MIDRRMSTYTGPRLLPQNEQQKKQIEQAKFLQEAIKSHVKTVSKYQRDRSTFYFYYADDFQLPSKDQLDAMWDFFRTQNPIPSGFGPLREAHFFVGPWRKEVGTFTIPVFGDVIVNISDDQSKADSFSTEFCQVILPESSSILSLAHDEQEKACNKFGVAMAFIKRGDPYEKYMQEAIQQGRFSSGKTLEWGLYTQRAYEYLISGYNSKFTPNRNMALSNYAAELVVNTSARESRKKPQEGQIADVARYLFGIFGPGGDAKFWPAIDLGARMVRQGAMV